MDANAVLVLLQKQREAAGGVRALARRWKLSVTYVSLVLRGALPPGPKILAKMGLTRSRTVTYEYDGVKKAAK